MIFLKQSGSWLRRVNEYFAIHTEDSIVSSKYFFKKGRAEQIIFGLAGLNFSTKLQPERISNCLVVNGHWCWRGHSLLFRLLQEEENTNRKQLFQCTQDIPPAQSYIESHFV